MKWSDKIPTEPGHYWVRGPKINRPMIVTHLIGCCNNSHTALSVVFNWEYYGTKLGRPLQWSGPIQEPE